MANENETSFGGDEQSIGDVVEKWLQNQKKSGVLNPDREAVEKIGELAVYRDPEGDVYIQAQNSDGKKMLISISRKIRPAGSEELVLTSHEINPSGNLIPAFTYLVAKPVERETVHLKAQTTEYNIDLKRLLKIAKKGLGMLKTLTNTSTNREMHSEKVADYYDKPPVVKDYLLEKMIEFINIYIERD